MSKRRKGNYVACYRGGRFWPLDPRHEDLSIRDIAHHLSLICRYGGAARYHYSVAQHSVLVSQNCNPQYAKQALLHDAAEAYIGDMVRPLKEESVGVAFEEIEATIRAMIFERYGVAPTKASNRSVDTIDKRIVIDEVKALFINRERFFRPGKLRPLRIEVPPRSNGYAETMFLARFNQLWPGEAV